MAQETILVNFRARGDKKLIRSMYALAQAQARLEKNAKTAAVSQTFLGTAFSRNTKGASAFSLSLSTLRSKLLLVSFGLGLVANSLTRAIGAMAKSSQQLNQMETAFDNLVTGAESSAIALDKLSAATNGTVSNFDLLQQANNAMILGVSRNSDEMAEMFDMAQRLGKALGVDTKRSIESLITGIGRQSRLMLDNIGIIVKADEAYEAYAKEIGKTADNLTDAEKKQAFFNATMDSAREKLKSIGEETEEGDAFQRLGASAENFSSTVGEALAPALESMAEVLADILDGGVAFLQWLDLVDTALERSIGKINEEQVATRLLKNELNQTTQGTKDYLDVKDKIIARFPNYFKNIEDEKIGMDLLNKALDEHNEFLMQKIRIEVANEVLSTKKKQLVAAIAALTDREIKQAELQVKLQNIIRSQLEAVSVTLGHTTEEQKNFVSTMMEAVKSVGFLKVGFKSTKEEYTSLSEAIMERGLVFGLDKAIRDNLFKWAEWRKSSGITQVETREDAEETIAKLQEQVETQQSFVDSILDALGLTGDKFKKSTEGIKEGIDTIDKMSDSVKQAERDISSLTQATTSFWLSSQQGARTWERFGDVIIQQMERIVSTFLANWATFKLMSMIFKTDFTNFATAPSLFGFTFGGSNNSGSADVPELHSGGMIQSYHQGGNVPIMAQEGEFVMRRSAVESIGLENLNRMNRTGQSGGVNINFSGNVLSGDFIENEAIPKIKDAVRRGADIGIS
ncbi:MAG: hypothetical protein GOVbin212_17 [Prokaryotic dsDNA virus sp.]|nr:MAG: hypothetical protein GOVbin212_17 [Prokaryotic dsDNA virus sp.]|tara:strand:+ start:3208 stop:5430 length:2223 start_codon:yes stop_codon:yes gene_type:complete